MEHVTTLLLVDGDSGALRGLRMRLALEPDLRVVGEAGRDADVAALATALAPNVIVVDIDPPDDGAVERVRALAATHTVVVLSLHDDRTTATAMQACGAQSFVGKHEGVRRLLDVIRSVSGDADGRGP